MESKVHSKCYHLRYFIVLPTETEEAKDAASSYFSYNSIAQRILEN